MSATLKLCALAAALAAAPLPAATTVTLRPDGTGTSNGDAFVTTGPSNNLTGNNYGGAGAITVSAPGMPQGEQRSILRFDISTATSSFNTAYGVGQWAITGAQLELTAATPNNGIFNANAAGSFLIQWTPNDSWTEGTGNPNTPSGTGVKWTDIAGLATGAESEGAQSFSGANGTVDYTLSPSSGFLNDIASGGPVSFILSTTDPAMSALFDSRSFGTASGRPALILTAAAVPEPGRVGLLLFAGLGTLLRRRRGCFNDTSCTRTARSWHQ